MCAGNNQVPCLPKPNPSPLPWVDQMTLDRMLPPQEQLRLQPPPGALSGVAWPRSVPLNGFTRSPSEDTALPANTGHGWPYQGGTGTAPALTPAKSTAHQGRKKRRDGDSTESEQERLCIWSDVKWDECVAGDRGGIFSPLVPWRESLPLFSHLHTLAVVHAMLLKTAEDLST